jgi:hypothetical protein
MDSDKATSDQNKFWAPYVPTKEMPWDLKRVVHLHRRAGFAAKRLGRHLITPKLRQQQGKYNVRH